MPLTDLSRLLASVDLAALMRPVGHKLKPYGDTITMPKPKNELALRQKGKPDDEYDWASLDVAIKRDGSQIILPAEPYEMPYEAAIEAIQRTIKAEAQVYDVHEFIPGGYWDAGLAFYKAMQMKFGLVNTTATPTWFGEKKPDLITVRTGPNPLDVVQMPLGMFNIPNVEHPIQASFYTKDGVPGFMVFGQVRKRDRAVIVELAALAKQILRENSIYRGQAIRLQVDDKGVIEFDKEPEFLQLAGVKESDLIFNADTANIIDVNLFTPIKNTDNCRRNKIPLKRGILLEGPYGCGKSLTARVSAKVASDNGWTFIILDKVQGLRQAIEFARLYQPAVIFAEDIDRIAEDRANEETNSLVNMLDGVLTKDVEIMVVLTTNFVEKIDKAVLRHGRFDVIVHIDLPDATAATRLIRLYAMADDKDDNGMPVLRSLLPDDENLEAVANVVAGMRPASIREVVDRAKLGMVMEGREHLTATDLRTSAVSMQRHLDLMADAPVQPSVGDQLAANFRTILAQAAGKETDAIEKLEGIGNEVDETKRYARIAAMKADDARDFSASAADSSMKGKDETHLLRREVATLTEIVRRN